MNFLDKIARFWELQGSSLKIPVVDKKALDLYTLHKLVEEDGNTLWNMLACLDKIKMTAFSGGMDDITRERRWTTLACKMGLKTANNKGIGGILRTHYERIVHPYVIFQSGKNLKRMNESNGKIKVEKEDDKDYVPHHIPSRMAVKPPSTGKNVSSHFQIIPDCIELTNVIV